MRLTTALLGGLAAICLAGTWPAAQGAAAADLSYPSSFGAPAAPITQRAFFLSEVRLGTFAHDPLSPEKGSVDVNGEILFAKPFSLPGSAWDFLLPRPSIGATINVAGKTSQGYAGLTWTYDITKSIFVEGSFGGSVNNGKTGLIVPVGRSALGCNVSFRESASIGYRFNANWSLMGTIEHMSNSGLCTQNRGLTNYGARIGYSF
ncbi:Lipid A 3-O-deacylase (PagL) [Rhizobiales bacterium GAS191]|nr:Lipid A 3-O-deacylase (PagL) [Rhizobiales bacterium GAS188]SED27148.1 Lipid A 3-O-deacylase (PagL) [Rhizobiales bacterium GAS191]